jgi:hypothetical protein
MRNSAQILENRCGRELDHRLFHSVVARTKLAPFSRWRSTGDHLRVSLIAFFLEKDLESKKRQKPGRVVKPRSVAKEKDDPFAALSAARDEQPPRGCWSDLGRAALDRGRTTWQPETAVLDECCLRVADRQSIKRCADLGNWNKRKCKHRSTRECKVSVAAVQRSQPCFRQALFHVPRQVKKAAVNLRIHKDVLEK